MVCCAERKFAQEGARIFKILVVEDNAGLNKLVYSFLNQCGYEAAGCFNANDAYDAMYGTMFDCIIFRSVWRAFWSW